MIKIYELSARYDKRASFYGKARIKETPKYYTLISYDTEILRASKDGATVEFLCREEWAFSATTCRHINEFLRQFTSERSKSKRELLKMARG